MNADEAAAERRKARTFKKFSYRGVEVRHTLNSSFSRSFRRTLSAAVLTTTPTPARTHATTNSSPSCSTSTRRLSPSSFTLVPVADSSAASSASRSRS